ncbi:MAG: hypothetical protein ABIH04_02260, partial [Planctomycetota bacterium]
MNIVLFTGAGFSRDAGYPVTSDFAKITHVSDYRYGLRKNRQSSNPIPYETFQGLQAAWHHAHESVPVEPTDNFESVFCLIDFHSAIHPCWQIAYWKEINDGECERTPAEFGLKIDYVKKLFTRAIYYTFSNPHSEMVTKEEWLGEMEEIYRSAVQKLAKHNLTIVSTNYDLLAEQLFEE